MKTLTIIGRAERVDFPELNFARIPAKIDTGADVSSIWASSITEQEDKLIVLFFGPESEFYTGQPVIFEKKDYTLTRIANSFGQKELRYKVKVRILVKGKFVRATFTLSDRSKKTYPVLLGRKLLSGKFLVDVREGEPLVEQERLKKEFLKKLISKRSNSQSGDVS